jgi:hypothetical protein
VAHEDDAERAVRAALAMQEALTEAACSLPAELGLPDLSLEQKIGISPVHIFSVLGPRAVPQPLRGLEGMRSLDDIQWIDQASLALLEHLLPLVDRVPLMLLLLYRPERGKRCREAHEKIARHLALTPTPAGPDPAFFRPGGK